MKRLILITFALAMIFSLTACGKDVEMLDGDGFEAGVGNSSSEAGRSNSESVDPSGESDSAPAEVARVENGRLSGIEPPEGWLQGEAMSENQLIYQFKHDLYDEYPQDAPEITIDIDEYDTPEEKLERTKEISEDWEEEYEAGEVTIDGVAFLTFSSQSQTYIALFGTKDGVTLSISVSTRLDLDNPDVIAIIGSLHVAAE
ncbi:hypothetical protein LJC64_01730 [Ruminococcaceae bacterium OttesenSCG-928-A11]|nr:hypothetical protein [Ruminococcaceae bacterium OttesenSCG-928-A11]